MKYDFGGYVTRNNLRCSDGRVICQDAFKADSGRRVPLVWNHQQNDPDNILGHVILENRPDGVYGYGVFNDTDSGRQAKSLVQHGDVNSMSIYANKLRHNGANVTHGVIREVSLVLAGANPGAFIDDVVIHGDNGEEITGGSVLYTGEELSGGGDAELSHSEQPAESTAKKHNEEDNAMAGEASTQKEETVQDVWDTLSEKQKTVVYALIGSAIEDAENDSDDEEDDEDMKHNLFDGDGEYLCHADAEAFQSAVISDAKSYGSMKESFLAHANEYGINNIDYLFPDDKELNNPPAFIKRDTGWVGKVMGAVHHTPFSRIKSTFANITEDEARARGYIKGKRKKEEAFSLLKRTTQPTTVYKKQRLNRDDVIDITSFDVVAWLKSEMRMMLDEELARAFLIGDGRLASSDDKISPDNIRPIATDDDMFTIKASVPVAASATGDEKARAFIRAAIKSRKDYKGSGSPTLFTTEDVLTDCLLIEDTTGRAVYNDAGQLANKLRVKEIVTVPVLEGATGKNGGELLGIIVNLADYNVGADKGGAVSMFDDFDIDYNQQKYLIETRCSGALIKPYSAIALEVSDPAASGGETV